MHGTHTPPSLAATDLPTNQHIPFDKRRPYDKRVKQGIRPKPAHTSPLCPPPYHASPAIVTRCYINSRDGRQGHLGRVQINGTRSVLHPPLHFLTLHNSQKPFSIFEYAYATVALGGGKSQPFVKVVVSMHAIPRGVSCPPPVRFVVQPVA